MPKRGDDRRSRMLAAAKQQMEENGISFSGSQKQWSDSDADGFCQGERSAYKEQRNRVNRFKRWATKNVRGDIAQSRHERNTDFRGRDWVPMAEGTLVEFVKDDTRFAGSRFKKGAFATVVNEFETDGKRWVEVLVGVQVISVPKSVIKEL